VVAGKPHDLVCGCQNRTNHMHISFRKCDYINTCPFVHVHHVQLTNISSTIHFGSVRRRKKKTTTHNEPQTMCDRCYDLCTLTALDRYIAFENDWRNERVEWSELSASIFQLIDKSSTKFQIRWLQNAWRELLLGLWCHNTTVLNVFLTKIMKKHALEFEILKFSPKMLKLLDLPI
jgi:hypothetical protein